ncbi:hypothetical protein D0A36_17550 [Xanthomonas campestris]|nr:hypothetical protein D0A41_16235 [Xanthomonas campestris]RFF56075.1 hypothetical protein D0A36_17550 [Xanthomonas campestris]
MGTAAAIHCQMARTTDDAPALVTPQRLTRICIATSGCVSSASIYLTPRCHSPCPASRDLGPIALLRRVGRHSGILLVPARSPCRLGSGANPSIRSPCTRPGGSWYAA